VPLGADNTFGNDQIEIILIVINYSGLGVPYSI
jgi:hypothetical protein